MGSGQPPRGGLQGRVRVRGERGEGANCCSESRSGTGARRAKCPGLCSQGAARLGQKIIKFKFHLSGRIIIPRLKNNDPWRGRRSDGKI